MHCVNNGTYTKVKVVVVKNGRPRLNLAVRRPSLPEDLKTPKQSISSPFDAPAISREH